MCIVILLALICISAAFPISNHSSTCKWLKASVIWVVCGPGCYKEALRTPIGSWRSPNLLQFTCISVDVCFFRLSEPTIIIVYDDDPVNAVILPQCDNQCAKTCKASGTSWHMRCGWARFATFSKDGQSIANTSALTASSMTIRRKVRHDGDLQV